MSVARGGWGSRLLVGAGLLAGLGLALLLVLGRQPPSHSGTQPAVPELSFITVRAVPLQLEARGHGLARAAESWDAIANVPGRVTERHPGLESGTLLRAGTVLLVLDPSRYELAIAEAKAELASFAAERDQLDIERDNTRRLLALERERLTLAEQELSRMERLQASGSVSRSRLDEQHRTTVAQRQAVASLENQLALHPARREYVQAQIARAETRLDQARQDLADTRFEAPYDLRISAVEIGLHQHATAGQRLFRADSIEAAEIEAHVPLPMLRRLVGGVLHVEPPPDALDIAERLDFSAIDAEVRLAGTEDVRWAARVTGIASGVDPATRTVRVVVTVDAPYAQASPPERPALQPGMYMQVRLSAPSPEPRLVVPAAAVHDGTVYRVAEGNRLQRQAVAVAFEQGDLAVIDTGLSPGDRVIVDDPVPALDGMPVSPRQDAALERRVRLQARGEVP